MGFFVVGRSTTDGALAMLGPSEYDTREAAARGIQALASEGSIDVSGVDVYIVDMAGAAPVVIVGMAPTAPAEPVASDEPEAAAPAAGAWETPEAEGQAPQAADEPQVADEVAEPTTDADLDAAAQAIDEEATPGLADALKRATQSLEEEGIVAPESIGPAVVADTLAEDVSDVLASLNAIEQETGLAPVAEEPAEEWPWANVESVDESVTEESAEAEGPESEPEMEPEDEALAGDEVPEVAVAETIEVETDLEGDDSLIMTSPAFGDDPFAPRAVIMGDYEETSPAEEAAEEVTAVSEPEPEVTTEPASDEAPGAPEVAEDALPEIEGLPGAYELSGDLELETYSCTDCVYSNTCPKVGQSSPAECGSFQWKAM